MPGPEFPDNRANCTLWHAARGLDCARHPGLFRVLSNSTVDGP